MLNYICLIIVVLPTCKLAGRLVLNMTKYDIAQEQSLLNTIFQISGGSSRPTCQEAVSVSIIARYFPYETITSESETDQFVLGNYFVCKFHFTGPRPGEECLMKDSEMCNGWSTCLTDECGCGSPEVFFCGDGSGCIAMHQVRF